MTGRNNLQGPPHFPPMILCQLLSPWGVQSCCDHSLWHCRHQDLGHLGRHGMAPHPKPAAQGSLTDHAGMKDRGELPGAWGRAQTQVSDCPSQLLHFLWGHNKHQGGPSVAQKVRNTCLFSASRVASGRCSGAVAATVDSPAPRRSGMCSAGCSRSRLISPRWRHVLSSTHTSCIVFL